MIDISIIIVNYNSGDLLEKCVESIIDNIKIKYEVIIVDNDSKDNSLDFLVKYNNDTTIIVKKNNKNMGFAKANNIATELSSGRYLHFLNPDTLVDSTLNHGYKEIFERNEIDIYVTKIMDDKGSVVKSWELIPTLKNYFISRFNKKKQQFWYLGASVIMRKETFFKLGGWAEDYFMYAEDLELFYKSHLNNIPISVLDATIFHIGGGTTVKVWSKFEREIKVQYANKLFAKKYNLLVDFYVLKMLVIVKDLFTNPKESYFTFKVLLKTITMK